MTNRVCPDSWGPPVHGLRILHKCKCEYVERLWSSGSPSPSLYISEGVTRTSSWLSGLYDVMDHNNVFTGPGSQLGVRVERFREVHINTDVPTFALPPLLNAPHTTWPTQKKHTFRSSSRTGSMWKATVYMLPVLGKDRSWEQKKTNSHWLLKDIIQLIHFFMITADWIQYCHRILNFIQHVKTNAN